MDKIKISWFTVAQIIGHPVVLSFGLEGWISSQMNFMVSFWHIFFNQVYEYGQIKICIMIHCGSNNWIPSSRHFPLRTKVKHETTSVTRQSQKWQCQLWSEKTLSVARHFQYKDTDSSNSFCWDIVGCDNKKDIVRCEIFSVLRHFQFLSKRHCLLWDICSFKTFAVFIK